MGAQDALEYVYKGSGNYYSPFNTQHSVESIYPQEQGWLSMVRALVPLNEEGINEHCVKLVYGVEDFDPVLVLASSDINFELLTSAQLGNGDFMISGKATGLEGEIQSGYMLVRFSAEGEVVWSKLYAFEFGNPVFLAWQFSKILPWENDEVLVITGRNGWETGSTPNLLLHIDPDGNILGQQSFTFEGSHLHMIDMVNAGDGHYYVLAVYPNVSVPEGNCLLKLSTQGLIWAKEISVASPEFLARNLSSIGEELYVTGAFLDFGPTGSTLDDFQDGAIACFDLEGDAIAAAAIRSNVHDFYFNEAYPWDDSSLELVGSRSGVPPNPGLTLRISTGLDSLLGSESFGFEWDEVDLGLVGSRLDKRIKKEDGSRVYHGVRGDKGFIVHREGSASSACGYTAEMELEVLSMAVETQEVSPDTYEHVIGVIDIPFEFKVGKIDYAGLCPNSIDEATDPHRVKLYPQPVADLLTLEGLRGETLITIYDLQGNMILREGFDKGGVMTMKVDTLPQGMYVLLATDDLGVYSSRIIKM